MVALARTLGASEMFRNVLVGVDRHGGRDAVTLAQQLLTYDGELTLAHVYPGEGGSRQYHDVERDSAERAEALDLLESACARLGRDAHVRWRESDSVGRGLHELCELIETDLLVVGSSHRGLLGRVLVGNDTRAALNGAPCAIAVAPAGYAEQSVAIREIGVGYNGSPESEHAVEFARVLAAQTGATLSAFEAVSFPTYTFLGGPAPIGDAIDDLVEGARERIEALGGVEAHAVYGTPVEELALYSASLDLLVVGSRSYGPVGRLVHGSTSNHLAHVARCPLLVLPRSAHLADAEEGSGEARTAVMTRS